jgi:hypothetical protein
MIYWAFGPFVRSFTPLVDPGDIYPPQQLNLKCILFSNLISFVTCVATKKKRSTCGYTSVVDYEIKVQLEDE